MILLLEPYLPYTNKPWRVALCSRLLASMLAQPLQAASYDLGFAGGKNILRGFFLAFLATFTGCIFFYTLPDAIAAALGRVMPFWFYEGQTMLLAIGSCTMNWLFTAFTC